MSKLSLRAKSYRILRPYLESQAGEWPSRLFDYSLIVLIIANAIAMMLETVPHIVVQWGNALNIFDAVSVAVFTAEYVTRVWCCVEKPEIKHADKSLFKQRVHYMLSPMAIVDLLAILPFYLGMFINLDLRILRILRLTRLIKLGRYSHSVQLLWQVLRNEARTLFAAMSVLVIVMTFAATGIYYLERELQPEVFGTIPNAMWWALVTLTTLGYGDVIPVTATGKVFSGLVTLLGVTLYALPAGILSSSFTAQLHLRRERFRALVNDAMEDGYLSGNDYQHIEKIRELLYLDKEEAELIVQLLKHRQGGHSQANDDNSSD
ncbi:ion transporter [Alteromonas sp. C1M14]|uniref:ion transporter n=1 Tax=Alteromonas sp. C1M14 TaxID=2841567 RepID=UPI001C099BDF|nr:ion transporter [Alteromonas sp. C1M14]MBU2978304.1 ion transporter [Alteromonas sp. C1M14]